MKLSIYFFLLTAALIAPGLGGARMADLHTEDSDAEFLGREHALRIMCTVFRCTPGELAYYIVQLQMHPPRNGIDECRDMAAARQARRIQRMFSPEESGNAKKRRAS